MTVSGISSNLFTTSSQTIQAKIKQFQQEFQQLGSDLQSGKVSAAQSDFVTLQQLGAQSQSGSASAAQSSNPIAQAFVQLGKDLQSGNVSGAQQDFSTLQQAFQNQAAQTPAAQTGSPTRGHHHHHHGGGESSNSIVAALRSASSLPNSARSCNPAISPLRRPPTTPCSRTSHRPVPAPHRLRRRPRQYRARAAYRLPRKHECKWSVAGLRQVARAEWPDGNVA